MYIKVVFVFQLRRQSREFVSHSVCPGMTRVVGDGTAAGLRARNRTTTSVSTHHDTHALTRRNQQTYFTLANGTSSHAKQNKLVKQSRRFRNTQDRNETGEHVKASVVNT